MEETWKDVAAAYLDAFSCKLLTIQNSMAEISVM